MTPLVETARQLVFGLGAPPVAGTPLEEQAVIYADKIVLEFRKRDGSRS